MLAPRASLTGRWAGAVSDSEGEDSERDDEAIAFASREARQEEGLFVVWDDRLWINNGGTRREDDGTMSRCYECNVRF